MAFGKWRAYGREQQQTRVFVFRSLACLSDMMTIHLIDVLKQCAETRTSMFFRAAAICKDLENYVAMLRFFVLSFQQAICKTILHAANVLVGAENFRLFC